MTLELDLLRSIRSQCSGEMVLSKILSAYSGTHFSHCVHSSSRDLSILALVEESKMRSPNNTVFYTEAKNIFIYILIVVWKLTIESMGSEG